jgi:hypothetical protein
VSYTSKRLKGSGSPVSPYEKLAQGMRESMPDTRGILEHPNTPIRVLCVVAPTMGLYLGNNR